MWYDPLTGYRLVARTVPSQNKTQKNRRDITFMPRVGLETLMPAFGASTRFRYVTNGIGLVTFLLFFFFFGIVSYGNHEIFFQCMLGYGMSLHGTTSRITRKYHFAVIEEGQFHVFLHRG